MEDFQLLREDAFLLLLVTDIAGTEYRTQWIPSEDKFKFINSVGKEYENNIFPINYYGSLNLDADNKELQNWAKQLIKDDKHKLFRSWRIVKIVHQSFEIEKGVINEVTT